MKPVARFPPLPPIPQPEEAVPDERQQTSDRIARNLGGSLDSSTGSVQVANVITGFRASAVDLGVLQDMLGRAIEHLDMASVRERWNEDLFLWFHRALMTWIQRCK